MKKRQPKKEKIVLVPPKKQQQQQKAPWSNCFCGLCKIGCGVRFIGCLQIFVAFALLTATLLGYSGVKADLADTFLIAVVAHCCLAFCAGIMSFLALHFCRPWLLFIELAFLGAASAKFWLCTMLFELYALIDVLEYVNSWSRCDELGCEPIIQDQAQDHEHIKIKYDRAIYSAIFMALAVLYTWFFFGVVFNAFRHLRQKRYCERLRRKRAAESMGCGGRSGAGGLLVAACVGGSCGSQSSSSNNGHSNNNNASQSRSTLTTSMTTTTASNSYDHSKCDPDLLLRY